MNPDSTQAVSPDRAGMTMLEICGATRLVLLVADPVDHLKGFHEFNEYFAKSEARVLLLPAQVRSDNLREFINGVRSLLNLQGLIISVPHKQAVVGGLDDISPEARAIGAVNAVRREPDGKLLGANFDGKGLVRALHADGISLEGRRVLLLGAGGAGRSIAFHLASCDVQTLGVYDIDRNRSESLVTNLVDLVDSVAHQTEAARATDFDVIINATPLGLNRVDAAPLELDTLHGGHTVVDIVNSPTTRLVEAARASGCVTLTGNAMMVSQISDVSEFLLATI